MATYGWGAVVRVHPYIVEHLSKPQSHLVNNGLWRCGLDLKINIEFVRLHNAVNKSIVFGDKSKFNETVPQQCQNFLMALGVGSMAGGCHVFVYRFLDRFIGKLMPTPSPTRHRFEGYTKGQPRGVLVYRRRSG